MIPGLETIYEERTSKEPGVAKGQMGRIGRGEARLKNT
jgi:hypothetical protein